MRKLEDKELVHLIDEFAAEARKAILGDDSRNANNKSKQKKKNVQHHY